MSYQRPILASLFYTIAIINFVILAFMAVWVVREHGRVGVLAAFLGGLPYFFAALVMAGVGQLVDLLGRIEYNTRRLREEAEDRAQREQTAKGGQPGSVRYIAGIND